MASSPSTNPRDLLFDEEEYRDACARRATWTPDDVICVLSGHIELWGDLAHPDLVSDPVHRTIVKLTLAKYDDDIARADNICDTAEYRDLRAELVRRIADLRTVYELPTPDEERCDRALRTAFNLPTAGKELVVPREDRLLAAFVAKNTPLLLAKGFKGPTDKPL